MKTRHIRLAALALVAMVPLASGVAAESCPRHEVDGVSASACQIGDDVQVLAHNYNAFPVNFSVKVTYRLKHEGERSRWVEARLDPYGGGQLADWRDTRGRLVTVLDVEVRNVAKR
jgi:hypothetical protein